MRTLLGRALRGARRRFYNLGGPWYRARLFELLGSRRYSSPALFGMDRKLAELMPWRDGTFVEAGAHDGYTQSNTYYLERERGWSGLLVEAIPELERKARRRRPRSEVLGCALVGPSHRGDGHPHRRQGTGRPCPISPPGILCEGYCRALRQG